MKMLNIERPDEASRLRRTMTQWSMMLRQSRADEHEDQPRYVSYDNLRLSSGETLSRKKVILMTGGCSVPTCTMCPFTNENNYGHTRSADRLLQQIQAVLAQKADEPSYELLSLYNDGSFFAPSEVPADIQLEIARLVAQMGIRRLVVESLPQFVTRERLQPFAELLGDVELEIGIGFQSAHDVIREILVNTRVSQRAFEGALSLMAELGVIPKIYLMIKPPFVTEAEALTDVIDSVAYLKSRGVEGVTLCPTRVSRNTVAWELYQTGDYAPPNLWTVLEAVRIAHRETAVRVFCINLRGSDFESVFPDSCPLCADAIVDALLDFSETGNTRALDLDCDCRPALEPAPLETPRLLQRAISVLERRGIGDAEQSTR